MNGGRRDIQRLRKTQSDELVPGLFESKRLCVCIWGAVEIQSEKLARDHDLWSISRGGCPGYIQVETDLKKL